MKHRKEPGLQDAPGDCEQQTTHPLQTVAERSVWKSTSTHADVMAFCRALVERAPQVTLEIVGKTYEGRELPLLILADPPIATPTEANGCTRTIGRGRTGQSKGWAHVSMRWD